MGICGLHTGGTIPDDQDLISFFTHSQRAVIPGNHAGVGIESRKDKKEDPMFFAILMKLISSPDNRISWFRPHIGMDVQGWKVLSFLLPNLERSRILLILATFVPEFTGWPDFPTAFRGFQIFSIPGIVPLGHG